MYLAKTFKAGSGYGDQKSEKDLEKDINAFFQANPDIKIVSVTQSSCGTNESYKETTVVVVYTQE